MNVPDLIVATMETLYAKYRKLKDTKKSNYFSPDAGANENVSITKYFIDIMLNSIIILQLIHPFCLQQYLSEVRTQAKALVTYCGIIPYFMTGDTYTKVMQIEVQMN